MRLRWEIFDAYKISVIDMPNLKSPLNIFLHVVGGLHATIPTYQISRIDKENLFGSYSLCNASIHPNRSGMEMQVKTRKFQLTNEILRGDLDGTDNVNSPPASHPRRQSSARFQITVAQLKNRTHNKM